MKDPYYLHTSPYFMCVKILMLHSINYYMYIHILSRLNVFNIVYCKQNYPSVYSACKSPRYDSHLLPITFPHVKQRIGIIIFLL